MTLTIHGTTYTTSTHRVLTTLFEKGVEDFCLQSVDLFNSAQKSPEFLKLQPFAQIPVLQDGDVTIYESRAIARYISDKYKDQGTSLFGATLAERALVNQWCEVESQHFHPPASLIVGQVAINPLYGLPTDEALVVEQAADLAAVLDVYESQLGGRSTFLAGDFFSMADLFHIPFTEYLVNHCGKEIQELVTSRKNVNAWWTNISSRPSFQKVLALKNKKYVTTSHTSQER